MAKYITPDFDVTVYEIQDKITYDEGLDGDEYLSWNNGQGGLEGGEL